MGHRDDRRVEGKKYSSVSAVIAIIVAIAAIIVIFVLFSSLGRANRKKSASSASADAALMDDDPTITLGVSDYTYKDDITNYLVIGTDHSGSYGKNVSKDDYHGEMADFLMVISVNDTDQTYTFLPINRDTMTTVYLMTTDGESNASADEQICTAHWYGGNEDQSCQNTVRAVSDFLGGLPIKGYYCLSMDSIKELNHAVGGVTVTVQGDFSQVDKSLVEGQTITLSDDQAFTYVHERLGMQDDNTNAARMNREQDFLDGFISQARAKIKENPSFANDLYDDLRENSVTDLTGNQVSRLINSFATKDNKGSLHIEGDYREGKILDDNEPHGIFEADPASVLDNLSMMLGLVKK